VKRQEVRIGCAGWNIPREVASDFPSEGSHLLRYSQVFNCVEINSSFYREHKLSTWERWRETVPSYFRFSVKAPRAITHDAKLQCGAEALAGFLRQVAGLGEKLGPILFQLPPSLEFERATVSDFLTMLRQDFEGNVVWEPRHKSWFGDEATGMLRAFEIARVAADPACVPSGAHPVAAGAMVYFRLHGSPRRYYSSYDDSFLRALSMQVAESANGVTSWCVFDNTASGAATRNALMLARRLAE
jgi:uncharacterized protein YecE (DUF72 family)